MPVATARSSTSGGARDGQARRRLRESRQRFYPTPRWATLALLEHIGIRGLSVWEVRRRWPHVRGSEEAGARVYSSDVIDRGYPLDMLLDYTGPHPEGLTFDGVITNRHLARARSWPTHSSVPRCASWATGSVPSCCPQTSTAQRLARRSSVTARSLPARSFCASAANGSILRAARRRKKIIAGLSGAPCRGGRRRGSLILSSDMRPCWLRWRPPNERNSPQVSGGGRLLHP